MPRQSKSTGQVRIVAGQWRGRKLPVADVPGLRPTGDRVRETLFNWLQGSIAGSDCLDLFAGTGALGIEALSRYASSVTFVEPHRQAHRNICESLQLLQHDASVLCSSAQEFLSTNQRQFDVVFVDPPFGEELQWEILQSLLAGHVKPGALIYMESPTSQVFPADWPAECTIRNEKRFGDVIARVFSVTAEDEQ